MTAAPRPPRLATLDDAPGEWRSAVVAIGNFDGVHRGHQAVLAAARAEADRRGAACLMLTFEPHPRAFFTGRPLFRLTPQPLKAAAAAALGLDGALILPFDRALADLSAEAFVRDVLAERLSIGAAVTGYDFHFGKARRGTPEFLVAEGRVHGFGVTVIPACNDDAAAISSTRIRTALAAGDVGAARRLLGRNFAFAGMVAHGDARGRDLGYPTANMSPEAPFDLAHGVYAVRYLRPDGGRFDGVASYGRRPTFGGDAPVFETFLFDFAGDLYGETALVSLHAFIRPEERFDSAAALVARMDQDSINARALLERDPPGALDVAVGVAWAALARARA